MEINVEIAVQDMQNALKSLIYADKRVKAQQKLITSTYAVMNKALSLP